MPGPEVDRPCAAIALLLLIVLLLLVRTGLAKGETVPLLRLHRLLASAGEPLRRAPATGVPWPEECVGGTPELVWMVLLLRDGENLLSGGAGVGAVAVAVLLLWLRLWLLLMLRDCAATVKPPPPPLLLPGETSRGVLSPAGLPPPPLLLPRLGRPKGRGSVRLISI